MLKELIKKAKEVLKGKKITPHLGVRSLNIHLMSKEKEF